MIAENRYSGGSQILDVSEHLQRIGPAINQISDEPKSVLIGVEPNRSSKLLERRVTALYIADCIDRHTAFRLAWSVSLGKIVRQWRDGKAAAGNLSASASEDITASAIRLPSLADFQLLGHDGAGRIMRLGELREKV